LTVEDGGGIERDGPSGTASEGTAWVGVGALGNRVTDGRGGVEFKRREVATGDDGTGTGTASGRGGC
jgi:hypothetical protein